MASMQFPFLRRDRQRRTIHILVVVSSVVSHLTSYMQPLPAAAAHQPASYPVRSIVIRQSSVSSLQRVLYILE